jgi:hypothetical protein
MKSPIRLAKMKRWRKTKEHIGAVRRHQERLAKEQRTRLETEFQQEQHRKRVANLTRLSQRLRQQVKNSEIIIGKLRRKIEMIEKGEEKNEEKNDDEPDGSTSGSTDPADDDYDPTDDSDTNLSNQGIADVMRRAAGTKTQFQMLTRHTEFQFAWLGAQMVPYITTTTLDGKEYKEKAADDSTWVVSALEQLFVTLVWARHNKSLGFWAFFFQLPVRYVQKIIRRVTAAGARWARGRIHLPSEAEAKALLKDLESTQWLKEHAQVLHIDGTPWRTKTPSRPIDPSPAEREQYDKLVTSLHSFKHKISAVDIIVVCDSLGRLVFVDGPFVGTESQHFKTFKAKLREHLRTVGLPISSDAGFQLNDATVGADERCKHYQTVGPTVVRLAKFVLTNSTYFDAEKVDFFQKIMDSTRFVSIGRSVVETSLRFLKFFEIFKYWHGRIEGVDELGRYSVRMSEVLQFLAAATAKLIEDSPLRDKATFRLTKPDGAKYDFGYPDGATVHELISKCAKQFLPKGRSVEEALKEAERQAAAKKEELELAKALNDGARGPAKKRKVQKAKNKAAAAPPLPEIVPPEPEDDVVYADDVDDEIDEAIKFTSNRQRARLASAAIASAQLAARREKKKM